MWERYAKNTYHSIKKFNNTIYRIEIWVDCTQKTNKFYVALSSGKKRKYLKNFREDGHHRDGGIRALLWVKQQMFAFPEWFYEKYIVDDIPSYLIIGWADSRRRDIYKRLQKEGFYFMVDEKEKVLMKRVELYKKPLCPSR